MNHTKNGLVILASINLSIFLIYWIGIIIISGFNAFGILTVFIARVYYFLMLFSSMLAFFRHLELAVALQTIGCVIQGSRLFLSISSGITFSSLTFWEFVSNPFYALEIFSFNGYCVIAAGLLILEYKKYNAKKLN